MAPVSTASTTSSGSSDPLRSGIRLEPEENWLALSAPLRELRRSRSTTADAAPTTPNDTPRLRGGVSLVSVWRLPPLSTFCEARRSLVTPLLQSPAASWLQD